MLNRTNWTFPPSFDVEIDEIVAIRVVVAPKWDGVVVFNVVR